MENWSTIVVAFITGVLGPVIIIIIKNILNKKPVKEDMIIDACKVSGAVVAKIDEIKEVYSADRVWVAQFHNGGHFYPTGKSIAKFSIFYETVGVGANSIQSNLQNIFRNKRYVGNPFDASGGIVGQFFVRILQD